MEVQVTLDANGSWVTLKGLEDLRRGDRRAVNAVVVTELDPKSGAAIIRGSMEDDMTAAIAAQVIMNWSFTTLQLPSVNPASLDMLTLEQADNLDKALQPYRDAIQGRAAPVKGNEVPTSGSAS